ncbi:kiSS-1 receptor-like isoform X2 [Crassostrea virginica]|uniref:KiSS-1 receptor-like isoform X2 n=1 Tax=Crassostrea virginica TaxID=6565 RepID=A0A8B8BKT0_CRAVI|nr:kiSS-1 receptor-like isoform X2 [Crassostrea virginica]
MNNTSNIAGHDPIEPFPIIFTWSLLTFVGLAGNSVVIYITCLQSVKSATNTYILNLAVSDIAYLLVVVPFTCLAYIFNHWVFANFGCKLFIFTQYVTVHATCLTLMAMTIDRYQAIVYPIQSMNWRNTRASTFVCLGVWSVSIVLSLPFAIFHKEMRDPDNTTICGPDWPSPSIDKGATLAVVMTSYVIPLAAIIACYSRILLHLWRGGSSCSRQTSEANGTVPLRSAGQLRRKKRVTRMVAIVILLFAWCWLPIQFFTLWYKFDPDFPLIPALLKFKIFAHTLSYANSCVNPFVYAFMNEGVRKAFQKKFPAASKYCQCLSKPKQANPETSTMIDKAVMTTRAGVDSMATTHCSL